MRSARLCLVTLLGAGLAAASMALPASAQDAADPAAAAAPVAKKRKPAPKVLQVQIINQREATLTELTALGRTKNAQPISLASSISPGGKTMARINARQGCIFTVNGTFDDESTLEVASVNLCKDRRLTLVE